MKGFELVKREDHWALYNEDGHKIAATIPGCNSKLSIKNCEAIENGYDLDELAREACNITDPLRLDSQKYKQDPYFKIGFNKGFQKALEILGDKKFSEKQMYEFADYSWKYSPRTHPEYDENLIKQKTEWYVEIVMEQDYLKWKQSDIEKLSDCLVPKLDADGCLILRRQNEN